MSPPGPQAAQSDPEHSINHRQDRTLTLPLEGRELQPGSGILNSTV
jgi:hypothetical protein